MMKKIILTISLFLLILPIVFGDVGEVLYYPLDEWFGSNLNDVEVI
jgi:hypothetical protein